MNKACDYNNPFYEIGFITSFLFETFKIRLKKERFENQALLKNVIHFPREKVIANSFKTLSWYIVQYNHKDKTSLERIDPSTIIKTASVYKPENPGFYRDKLIISFFTKNFKEIEVFPDKFTASELVGNIDNYHTHPEETSLGSLPEDFLRLQNE